LNSDAICWIVANSECLKTNEKLVEGGGIKVSANKQFMPVALLLHLHAKCKKTSSKAGMQINADNVANIRILF
jgi:hypothetical protein